MIQSFSDSPELKKQVEQKITSWEDFYKKELKTRREYLYPPFCYILKIDIVRSTQNTSIKSAEKLKTELINEYPGLSIIGPAPALIEKKNDKWHWQLIVKSTSRRKLTTIIKSIPKNYSYDLDPTNLL